MTEKLENSAFVALTVDVVSAYVTNNHVQPGELGKLIGDVHAAITGIVSGTAPTAEPKPIEQPTAAQIRKSLTPDALISFEDGKPYKTLKRHLNQRGLTPQSYRTKWGLPNDYPMVAPNYAAQRSELAKAIGLGRPGARAEEPSAPPPPIDA